MPNARAEADEEQAAGVVRQVEEQVVFDPSAEVLSASLSSSNGGTASRRTWLLGIERCRVEELDAESLLAARPRVAQGVEAGRPVRRQVRALHLRSSPVIMIEPSAKRPGDSSQLKGTASPWHRESGYSRIERRRCFCIQSTEDQEGFGWESLGARKPSAGRPPRGQSVHSGSAQLALVEGFAAASGRVSICPQPLWRVCQEAELVVRPAPEVVLAIHWAYERLSRADWHPRQRSTASYWPMAALRRIVGENASWPSIGAMRSR